MSDRSPTLEYRTPNGPAKTSIARRVIFALAVVSAPVMLLTGIAAMDGFFNPHSDFVFEGWAKLFCLSCVFPALSLALRWQARPRT